MATLGAGKLSVGQLVAAGGSSALARRWLGAGSGRVGEADRFSVTAAAEWPFLRTRSSTGWSLMD